MEGQHNLIVFSIKSNILEILDTVHEFAMEEKALIINIEILSEIQEEHIMADRQFYDEVGLIEEAQRYKTSIGFLELLHEELSESDRLLAIGCGARLLTVPLALTKEFYGTDINQGSLDRAKDYIDSWEKYKNVEPFKTEFDFLDRKKLSPRFDNYHFFLVGDFPPGMDGSFDCELASELFLHMNINEIKQILKESTTNLRKDGKLIFTVYPTGLPDSLDEMFYELGSRIGMKRDYFIDNGVININVLSQRLGEESPDTYKENKNSYWLDLKKIRAFPSENIEKLCKDSGLKIKHKSNLNGGMFPLAHRLVYVLVR